MIRSPVCPICKKVLVPDDAAQASCFPFCSDRCRQIDLFRWCEGKYAIIEPLDPESLDGPPPEPAPPDEE